MPSPASNPSLPAVAPAGTQSKSLWLMPPRVILQRRAPRALRMHALRATARVLSLLVVDAGAFLLTRTALRAVRDDNSTLELVGEATRWAVPPPGSYGGWQMAAALLVGLVVAGAYRSGDDWHSLRRVLSGVTLGVSLVLWRDLWERGVAPVVVHYLAAVVGLGAAVAGGRLGLERLLAALRSRYAPAVEQVLLVGEPGEAYSQKVYTRLSEDESMQVVGWVTPRPQAGEGSAHGPVLGSLDELWSVLQRSPVDTVVLCGLVEDSRLRLLIEAVVSAGGRLLALSRYERLGWVRPSPVAYHQLQFMELTVPALRGQQLWVKRAVDLLGAGLGLLVISPLLALIALAIKLDTRGPVFFAQERVGLGGRTFRMLKFRTMRVGADAEKAKLAHLNTSGDARLFKIPNDPRVTRVGVFLRKWSLDELPQLFNVLRGDMSLVGPRPFFESDLVNYHEHHFGRLGARPGITGLWQVSGRSSITDFEEVVRLDCEYIHRWSLWLDLEILLKTLPAVVRRTGAY